MHVLMIIITIIILSNCKYCTPRHSIPLHYIHKKIINDHLHKILSRLFRRRRRRRRRQHSSSLFK